MRVTKRIEQFVYEEINKAIPTNNLLPEYDSLITKAKEIEEEYRRKLEDYSNKLFEEIASKNEFPSDWVIKRRSYDNSLYCDFYSSALAREENALRTEADGKRNKIAHQILVDMELGEINKKTLVEAIATAVKEANKE